VKVGRIMKKNLKDFTFYLSSKNEFEWQTVEINGSKTGGDPDLFSLFLLRGLFSVQKITGVSVFLFLRYSGRQKVAPV
jgi:hypothetical protein